MKCIEITPPADIQTCIQLPSSKSICNRALIINALAGSTCRPENLSDCDDTRVMIEALTHMPETIDIMAAGTAMRFLTAYLSVTPGTHVLTGTERMRQRPIKILVDALRSLGAQIEYTENEGYPPLKITGKALERHSLCLPGNVSSQYISALLMIGPMLAHGLNLELEGEIISRPYINLTLKVMKDFGAKAEWTSDHTLQVAPQPYHPVPYYVDWSAASYWYEIVALSKHEAVVTLPGLFAQSPQGDAKVAELFEQLGVCTQREGNSVTLKQTHTHTDRMEYNFVNQPDLAQTFVVTCAMLGIPFRFSGLQSLKIKETDRMAALIAEMRKLGYVLEESEGSVLSWNGTRCAPDESPAIDTYEDHRMAMAFAPAALCNSALRIRNPHVVSKSYPRFWEDLLTAGFRITQL
jgi:3-phosphoshikimate 1-carboxyvinyltransferase